MTKFRFDIIGIQQICERIYDKQKAYQNTAENLYRDVINAKNIWFDPASDTFNRRVLSDQISLNDALNSINGYYRNLNDFSNSLSDIFTSAGAGRGIINYDTPYISLAKDKFALINNYLNRAIENLEPREPLDFKKHYDIEEIHTSVIDINKKIININNKVKEIERDVEKLISVHRTKEKAIEFVKIDSNVTRFNWTVVLVARKSSPKVIRVVTYDHTGDVAQVNTSNLNLEGANLYTTRNNDVIESEVKQNTEIIGANNYIPQTEKVENVANQGQLQVASDMSLSIGPVGDVSSDSNSMQISSDMSLSIENKNSSDNGDIDQADTSNINLASGVYTTRNNDVIGSEVNQNTEIMGANNYTPTTENVESVAMPNQLQETSDQSVGVGTVTSPVEGNISDASMQKTLDSTLENGVVENSTLNVNMQSGNDKNLNTATVTSNTNSVSMQAGGNTSLNTGAVTNNTTGTNMVRGTDASINTVTIKNSVGNSGQMTSATPSDTIIADINS